MNELSPPSHDLHGLNILDPQDRRGHKSHYITLLQSLALQRYLPRGDGKGLAVDLGCGYGRMTPMLARQGWRVVGVDPTVALLNHAEMHHEAPGVEYLQGGLPDLPLAPGSVDLLMMQNLLRPLQQLGRLGDASGVGRYLRAKGWLVIVENIYPDHPGFVAESAILALARKEGLTLVKRIPLRAARWWMIYLIRYGLIPERWFQAIAGYELTRRARSTGRSAWQYHNVMFIFRKPSGTHTEHLSHPPHPDH